MRDDLLWWRYIFHDPVLNVVPLCYFNALPEPDVTVVTDSSDVGICALGPAHRLVLTYRFSLTETQLTQGFNQGADNEFGINYRELLACAFAVQAWGRSWQTRGPHVRPVHIHFRIDNISAVSWQSKMASRNTGAQVLIRLLGIWEVQFGLRFSAPHIPGIKNTAADAGSRRQCWHFGQNHVLWTELARPNDRRVWHRAFPYLATPSCLYK